MFMTEMEPIADDEVMPPRIVRAGLKIGTAGATSLGLALGIAVLVVLPTLLSAANMTVATEVGELALVTIGLVALHGYSGQLSLGQGGFMAVTAYTMAHMSARYHWPALAGLAFGLVLCVAVALVMGVVLLRMRGLYLALATLAFADIVETISSGWSKVTGGPSGEIVPSISFAGYAISSPLRQYVLAWVVVVVVGVVLHQFAKSPRGRALKAIGRDELMAGSLGVPVVRYKVAAFVISAALAGVAGALYAGTLQFVSPGLVGYQASLQVFVMHVLGGVGSIIGAIIGVAILQAVPQIAPSAQRFQLLIDGGVLLAVLRFFPMGIVPGVAAAVQRVAKRGPWRRTAGRLRQERLPISELALPVSLRVAQTESPPASGCGQPPGTHRTEDILRVQGIVKSFSGLHVLSGVTFAVPSGSITSVIGPNGAGKTTLLNVITGAVAPDRGVLELNGKRMHQPLPHKVARAGIGRTFQTPRLELTMSALDNVLTGGSALSAGSLPGALLGLRGYRKREKDDAEFARQLIRLIGLEGFDDRPAGQLPLGHQRRLEIARALMARPSLLVVDEPAAGSNDHERGELAELFKKLNESGCTVLLVEHNMDLVMSISHQVIVLDQGNVIGSGTPDEIRKVTAVIDAYLGQERASAAPGPRSMTGGADRA